MKHKVIDLSKHKATGEGDYGSFYPTSKLRGVKVLVTQYESIADLLASSAMIRAKEEADLLTSAYVTGIVPKCFGVVIVKKSKTRYHAGIQMQLLGTKTLHKVMDDEELRESIKDGLKNTLKGYGFNHKDLHANNVMVYKGKYWAIDFSPDYVKVVSPVAAEKAAA